MTIIYNNHYHLLFRKFSMLTLDQLPIREKAIIKGFNTANQLFRKKLLSMGITPGCKVEVIRVAPFRDPIQIKLRNFQLCLRQQEASVIIVE